MNKSFKVIIFTLSYFLGVISFLTDNLLLFSSLFFLLVLVLCKRGLFSQKYSLILLLIFTTGILNCFFRIKDYDYLSSVAPQNNYEVVGTVVSIPATSSDEYTKFNLETEQCKTYNQPYKNVKNKILVTYTSPKPIYQNIEIGDKLLLTGRLVKTKTASNPSEFCYSSFLKFKGIHSRLFVDENNLKTISKADKDIYGLLAKINRIRTKIIDYHSENIQSPQLELLGGIVFGDDAVTPAQEMKKSFQNSGLTHIIAASGMNVSMIFGMWFFVSQIFRLNYSFSVLVGIFAVICYTFMTGFGPPVLRASLMLILVLTGKLINKKANSVNLLFIVAFIMCLLSPSMITNIGFQLSFTVTLGLLLVYPLLFEKIKNKFVNTLLSFVLVPLTAQIFAAPIQMFYFNSFSPYSVFANIAVVPVLGLVSFLGFISCIFALIKPVAFISIKVFDFLLLPFLKFITNVADYFSNLPDSIITVQSPDFWQMLFYYIFVLGVISLFFRQSRWIKIFVISSFLLLAATCISFKNRQNEIIFFSVENADSALITTSEGKRILIDTGKAPYNNFSPEAEKIILKYFTNNGIKSLDLLILSHYDSDHAGGTTFITDKIKVKNMILRSLDDDSPLAKTIIKDASDKNIDVKVPEINEVLLDDGKNKIYVFYSDNGDDNDKSIITVFETQNGTALFAGEGSVKTFNDTKQFIPKNIQVLKVPHHGAKETVSDEILNYLNPEYAIISTGFNIYGHPDNETLSLLRKNNVKILRTDLDNAVKVKFSKNKILVYSYNNKHKKFERIK